MQSSLNLPAIAKGFPIILDLSIFGGTRIFKFKSISADPASFFALQVYFPPSLICIPRIVICCKEEWIANYCLSRNLYRKYPVE